MQQQLDHYKIEELLGEGSFARVYRAYDEKFEQYVALKILKPKWLTDAQAIARFKQEAKTVRRLRHAHIIDVYDVGETEGQTYLAQFLVEGETLAARLAGGPIQYEEAVKIVADVGSALDYAHSQGIIHRDIKPQNILLGPDNYAYLGDFGLVRAVEDSTYLSSTFSMVGTAHYMAPEVWRGKKAVPATDIYALSCVVFEMLTGKMLFEGSSMAELTTQHVVEGPQFSTNWPQHLPDGLTEVLQRGLAEDPNERIHSGGQLAEELKALSVPVAPISSAATKAKLPTVIRKYTSWSWKFVTILIILALIFWGLSASGVLDPILTPSIKIKNHLTLPVKIKIEDKYQGTIDAYSSDTFPVDVYPARVSFEVVKAKTSNNIPIGEEMDGIWDAVNRGETVNITPLIDEQMYFYPIITNNTNKDCSVTVNDGLASARPSGAVVESGGEAAGFGYYKLYLNSNVTLHCDDGSTFWWGNKEGKESSETPLYQLLPAKASLYQLLHTKDGAIYFIFEE